MHLLPFLTYVCVTTFTPGPNNILSMTLAMRYGYRQTLRFLGGVFAGFILMMMICGLSNVALLNLLPQVRMGLNILGAAYMVYLALHIILSRPAGESMERDGLNSFKAGFGLQFLNLKVILYGITVFSTFIVQTYHDPLSVSLFAPLLAGVGFIATSCWALGGDIFRHWLNRYGRHFNLAMGALLIYTAVASLIG